jgi:K+-transporting ATPase ATPase A chain
MDYLRRNGADVFHGNISCVLLRDDWNAALRGLSVDQTTGNWEAKKCRFGIANSALWATVTTNTSCGAVNAMHDSFTALGGLVPLANIQLGELVLAGLERDCTLC